MKWHLLMKPVVTFKRGMKCLVVQGVFYTFCSEQSRHPSPSITARGCCAHWHFVCCEETKVGCCYLWFICCCFSLGSCRGVEKLVLCLNVSSWDRKGLLGPLSCVQYVAMIMMDCPPWEHIYECLEDLLFKVDVLKVRLSNRMLDY